MIPNEIRLMRHTIFTQGFLSKVINCLHIPQSKNIYSQMCLARAKNQKQVILTAEDVGFCSLQIDTTPKQDEYIYILSLKTNA